MSLAALKEKIIALEMGRVSRQTMPLGLGVIDGALQGGLDLGAIHEFTGPAGFLFAQEIIRRRKGTTFWLCNERAAMDYNPAALLQYGGLPESFFAVYLQNGAEILQAAYEILTSKAVGCVVLGLEKPLTQTEARKLQLAAQGTSSLGLIVNMSHIQSVDSLSSVTMAGSVVTRWHVGVNYWSSTKTGLALSLTKNRRGHPRHWNVEIDHATHHLYLASFIGERETDTGKSGFGT